MLSVLKPNESIYDIKKFYRKISKINLLRQKKNVLNKISLPKLSDSKKLERDLAQSLSISGKNEELVIETILKVVDKLNAEFKDDGVVLGPTTPYISFEKDKYIREALVKYKDQNKARLILEKMVKGLANKSQISVSINIDPYNF